MNFSIYIFGSETNNSSKPYSQYPLDYAEDIFKKYESYLKNDSLLVIHRNDVAVYHIYITAILLDGRVNLFEEVFIEVVYLHEHLLAARLLGDAQLVVLSGHFQGALEHGEVREHVDVADT